MRSFEVYSHPPNAHAPAPYSLHICPIRRSTFGALFWRKDPVPRQCRGPALCGRLLNVLRQFASKWFLTRASRPTHLHKSRAPHPIFGKPVPYRSVAQFKPGAHTPSAKQQLALICQVDRDNRVTTPAQILGHEITGTNGIETDANRNEDLVAHQNLTQKGIGIGVFAFHDILTQ